MENGKLGEAFEQTISGSEIENISEENLDSLVDIITKNDLVDILPIIKYVSTAARFYTSIVERFQKKKLLVFLFELKKISDKERITLLKKIHDDPKFRQKTFERVAMIIERLDDVEKAKILGKLFTNYILKLIDHETFFRLSFVVEKTYLYDLNALGKLHKENTTIPVGYNAQWVRDLIPTINKALSQVGLMEESVEDNSPPMIGKYLVNGIYQEIISLDIPISFIFIECLYK